MVKSFTHPLRILECYTEDIGRFVGRIDHDSMDSLGASTGDIIELRGAKGRTVAKCLPLNPPDEGHGIIRIDGISRHNAAVEIGDTITVHKIQAVPAGRVYVVPLEAIPPIDERYIADALESVPLIKGDNVIIPYFGGRLGFIVVDTVPFTEPVLVNQKTEFRITGGTAVSEGSLEEIKFRIEYGVRSEADKTFLRMKFILSHFKAEQVGEFEKELKQDQLQKMFGKYRNAAEEVLADAKEQLTKKLREQKSVEVKLADILYAILDRCRSIKD